MNGKKRNHGLRHQEIAHPEENEQMLKGEDGSEQEQEITKEAVVDIPIREQGTTGPQSPPAYERPAPSSPNGQRQRQKRKLQFNMSSKIQIIPDNRQGQLNTAFLATIPGVLKIAEIILSFISFILAICSDRNATTAAWTEHISCEATVLIAILLIGYVCFPHLTIKDEPTREGLIVVELLFYGLNTLLFFIAIWLMVHLSASWISYGRGSAIIDAILCVALTVLFAMETIIKLRAWRGENAPSEIITTSHHTEPGKKYETDLELRRNQGHEEV